MAKPKLLGIEYAAKPSPVRDEWLRLAKEGNDNEKRSVKAKLKSLTTFETRAWANPLTAGDPVAKDRWPDVLARDRITERFDEVLKERTVRVRLGPFEVSRTYRPKTDREG